MQYAGTQMAGGRRDLLRLKQRAFAANLRAKTSEGSQREAFYRTKASAINYLLEAGFAFVNEVDWSRADAVIGITFAEGGRLHILLSDLSPGAFRVLRRTLGGCERPRGWGSDADDQWFMTGAAA